MTATFVSDVRAIEAETGLDIVHGLLSHQHFLDSPRLSTPFLLRQKGESTLILRHIDAVNLAAQGRENVRPAFYRPYFTFEAAATGQDVPRALSEAVARRVSGEKRIECGHDLPLTLYRELAGSFHVEVGAERGDQPAVTLYTVDRADMRAAFREGAREALGPCLRLASDLEKGDTVRRWLTDPRDRRPERLDALLSEVGLGAVLATSWLNLQELTGLARDRLPADAVALYLPGSRRIHVLGVGETELPRVRSYGSMAEALGDLAGAGVLGLEEAQLEVGRYRAWGLDRRETREATPVLRTWREECADEDLGFYLLAARATEHAMEGSLGWAAHAVEAGDSLTERDVRNRYWGLYGEFMREQGLDITWSWYIGSIFAGTRSLWPAHAVAYPLSRAVNTMKEDAGILVYDRRGLYRACSDLARTITFNEAAEEVHQALREAVLDHCIPALREGACGRDVFHAAMGFLEGRQRHFESTGMLPPLPPLGQVVTRDVGHLLAKQEPTAMPSFDRDAAHPPFKVGMVGCAEVHWPYRGHCLTVEDEFFISDEGPVVISRGRQ